MIKTTRVDETLEKRVERIDKNKEQESDTHKQIKTKQYGINEEESKQPYTAIYKNNPASYHQPKRGPYGVIIDDIFNHFDLQQRRKPLKQGMPGLQGVNYGFDEYEIDDSLWPEEALQVALHERGHNRYGNERENRNYINNMFGYNVEPGYYQGL